MKIGDKVRCIKKDVAIVIGREYIINRIDTLNDKPTVGIEGRPVHEYYADYFELIGSTLSIEEQIILAKSYIGKTVASGCIKYAISKVNVVLTESEAINLGIASYYVLDDISKNGFSVVVSDVSHANPVLSVELSIEFEKVKLNDSYTAEVFKDKLVVGCQTFPISILDELVKAHKSLD